MTDTPAAAPKDILAIYARLGVITPEEAEAARPDPGPDHWTFETVRLAKVTHTQTGKSAEGESRDEALGLKPFAEDIGGPIPFDLEADASRLWPMFPHEHLSVGDVFEVTRDGRPCALRVTEVIPGPDGQVMYDTEPA